MVAAGKSNFESLRDVQQEEGDAYGLNPPSSRRLLRNSATVIAAFMHTILGEWGLSGRTALRQRLA